jgi:hypothetical protein
MKTISSALTDSRMRFATVVLPEPVPGDADDHDRQWFQIVRVFKAWYFVLCT